ncbi:hypothetical protein YC2023_035663 [Brassica napus]
MLPKLVYKIIGRKQELHRLFYCYKETEAGTWNMKRMEAHKRSRFRKLPQGSDSNSGSEAGSGRPMKLPYNLAHLDSDLNLVSYKIDAIYN